MSKEAVFFLLILALAPFVFAEETCAVGEDGSQLCHVAPDPTAISQEDEDEHDDDCIDENEHCTALAKAGRCQTHSEYMLGTCARSCNACSLGSETKLYGVKQNIRNNATSLRIQEMHTYMTEIVHKNETFANVRAECKNRNKECAYWASRDECSKNSAFMNIQCAPACFACHLLDFDTRCPFDRDAPKFLNKPGDLDRFFAKLVENSVDKYNTTIFSGPSDYTNERKIPAAVVPEDAVADGPWVIFLEDFLSEEECDLLVELGHKRGYERSKGELEGKKKFDGTADSRVTATRTSTNTWCTEECYSNESVQEMTARLDALTGIPSNNSEYWQLLRYDVSQQYMRHNDFIGRHLNRSEGVRILTVFFYLNNVDSGGGTRFPALNNLTVQPVKGSCVIWPSVLNEDPNAKDPRTDHQALPVEEGLKFGANAWVHQRDFKTPHSQGCE